MAGVSRIADELAAHLRDRILTGALPGGTQLAEQTIAREYDVSRPTARTAMSLLSGDGLMTLHPHLPATVAAIHARDVPEILRLLETTEDLALSEVVRRDPDLRPLRAAQADSVYAFLDVLVELSGSQRLIRVHRRSTYELLLAEVAITASGSTDPEAQLTRIVRAMMMQDEDESRAALDIVQESRRESFSAAERAVPGDVER